MGRTTVTVVAGSRTRISLRRLTTRVQQVGTITRVAMRRAPQTAITLRHLSRTVVRSAVVGPRGAAGEDAVRAYAAGAALSGERVVYVNTDGAIDYADNTVLDHLYQLAGVTTQAGLQGAQINVRSHGPLEFSGWTWTPGLPVFLGANGALTQTPPLTGALLVIGGATSPTAILIRLGRPIRRT